MEQNKKVEYIKEQLKGVISVPYQIRTDRSAGYNRDVLDCQNVVVVDIYKLAEFLAKHLKISADDLLS